MGFISRLITSKIENAFDVMQSEAAQERLKEQDKQLANVQSLGRSVMNFGPMANLSTTFNRGVGVARTELENLLGSAFAPLTRDLNAFTGGVRNIFEDFFHENRLGGLVGQSIGQAAGFIAGFILPGGPLLWSQIFGFLGTFAGTAIQGGVLNPIHPNIPGTPGEIPVPPIGSDQGFGGGLPQHAIDLLNAIPPIVTPVYNAGPTVNYGGASQKIQQLERRMGGYII